ncbi:hypothetical protein CMU89_00310 [Elizabethkingia anophelis]|nr:hypothetical protein BBD30_11615 [Elizabethkingia anophelis]MDV3508482.1 hypothetical protein [Elizabethkingia anophelis]MDV3541116.1 hypothetical protein [Elizabethkingia anophelis]MDV4009970.1 hypothetical protein [Elizabethkingia anophelis]OPB63849.1 hypothetical protein BAS07_09965 [Elizabethkingia anophelis]
MNTKFIFITDVFKKKHIVNVNYIVRITEHYKDQSLEHLTVTLSNNESIDIDDKYLEELLPQLNK